MRGNLSSAECAATDAGGAAESAAMIDGEGCIAPMASSLLENCTNPGLLEVFLDDADEALLRAAEPRDGASTELNPRVGRVHERDGGVVAGRGRPFVEF